MEPLTRTAADGVADSSMGRTARARPAQITPSATVRIGIDVRVGGTAADFVHVSQDGLQVADADTVVVELPVPASGHALIRAADAGFAGTLHRALVPAQVRLSNEVDQLQRIRNATLEYLRALSSEGRGR
jgi:hypothetical protein